VENTPYGKLFKGKAVSGVLAEATQLFIKVMLFLSFFAGSAVEFLLEVGPAVDVVVL
jgi:hypothetical protein